MITRKNFLAGAAASVASAASAIDRGSIEQSWGRARGLMGGGFMGAMLAQQSATPPIPYDYEVEYIEGTSTQYIDTMMTGRGQYDYTIMYHVYGSRNAPIFGMRNQSSYSAGPIFCLSWFSSSTSDDRAVCYMSTNGGDSGGNGIFAGFSNITNRVVISPRTKKITLNDSQPIAMQNNTSGTIITNYSLFIFCNSIAGAPNPSRLNMKLYEYKVTDADAKPVQWLVPVVATINGVQQGAMYDRANPTSGEFGNGLYVNKGTGSFVVGPRV